MWDAREALTDIDDLSQSRDLVELATRLALIADTGGVAVVLPGLEAHQAVIVTIEGPKDGAVLGGPVVVDDDEQPRTGIVY